MLGTWEWAWVRLWEPYLALLLWLLLFETVSWCSLTLVSRGLELKVYATRPDLDAVHFVVFMLSLVCVCVCRTEMDIK